MKRKPKILIFDIETSMHELRSIGFHNTKYPVRIKASDITEVQRIHCIGYKWFGKGAPKVISVHDFPRTFKKNHLDDSKVITAFNKILEQADAVVGYNIKSYDLKHINSRNLLNKNPGIILPPEIDLFKIIKANFNLPSYKMDEVARFLGLSERKSPMERADWEKCYEGDLKSFKKMSKYCRQDIRLTEAVYRAVIPFIQKHPALSRIMGDTPKQSALKCPVCTSPDSFKNGFRGTKTGLRQRRICKECGVSWLAESLRR